MHAYNCTVNEATGFLRFYLFGWSPRLPVDLLLGTSSSVTNESHTEYVKRWKDAMKDAYTKANNNSNKAANAGKKIYDSKVRYIELKAGGRVLVRNLCERGGPGKLRSHWAGQIREVVEQKEGLLIFVVKPEGKTKGRSRVLHRNLLLQRNFLPPDGLADNQQNTPAKKKMAEIKSENRNRVTASSENKSDDESEYQGLTEQNCQNAKLEDTCYSL